MDWKRLSPTSQDGVGMGKIMGIAEERVAERFDPNSRKKLEKPNIIQSLLNNGLTQEETFSVSLLMIQAYRLRHGFVYYQSNNALYPNLSFDLPKTASRNRRCTTQHTRCPRRRSTQARLPQAVILEGIRIHPPPGGLLLRLTPPEGDTINGISITGGVEIGVNTWGMMRDEDVIGPDPEMFRPEQRLEIEEAKYAEMARVVDLTFGGGRYKCLVWGWPLWT